MIRAILSLILIAQVVACPLRCISCQVGTSQPEVVCVVDVCPCCQTCTDSQDCADDRDEDQDNGPCEACLCPNCICEGATLVEAPELPDQTEWLIAFVDSGIAHAKTKRHLSGAWAVTNSGLVFSRRVGRNMRVAHQSWII